MKLRERIVFEARLDIMMGVHLSDALRQASDVAKLIDAPVVFKFNGQDVKVDRNGNF